jgi:hypothetical protein
MSGAQKTCFPLNMIIPPQQIKMFVNPHKSGSVQVLRQPYQEFSCFLIHYLKCSYLRQFTSDFKKSKTYFSLCKRGFRNDKDLLSSCFGLENPLLLVGHLRCFRKKYFSSVTHTTHKETSAVCGGGGALVPL